MLCSVHFVITPLQDREEKLRYLLNFTGQRSTTYFIGIWLADIIIFIVPAIVLILLAGVLGVKAF